MKVTAISGEKVEIDRTAVGVIVIIAITVALICLVVVDGFPQNKDGAAPKAESVVKLTEQDKAEIKQVNEQFKLLIAQDEAIQAKINALQSGLAAKFNHLCAKAKLDPDLYQWTKDLDGIELKAAPKP